MRTIVCAGMTLVGIMMLGASSALTAPAGGAAIAEAAGAGSLIEQVRDCRRNRCRPARHARRYQRDSHIPVAPYEAWWGGPQWNPRDRRGNLSDSIQDSGMGRSDIRLKHGIALLGRLDNALGLYRFSYKGSHKVHVGVMAQEVRTVAPDAVMRGPDGYLRVDYERLGLRLQSWDEWVAAGRRILRGADAK